MISTKRAAIVGQFILFILIGTFSVKAAGEVDLAFSASAYGDLNNQGTVYIVKRLADGKMLVGGIFTEVHGYAVNGLARLNADGTIDKSFNPPDFYGSDPSSGATVIGGNIYAIAVQPDGKILVGGVIRGMNGVDRSGVRRLNADGSLDSSFFIQTLGGFGSVFDIELQADGKVLIGGRFILASSNSLARLNADGTHDTTFTHTLTSTTYIRGVSILADGKVLAGGFVGEGPSTCLVRRFNSDGSNDGSFSQVTSMNSGSIEALEVQSDGKIAVAGNYTDLNAVSQGRVSRLNSDGTLDLTFNQSNEGAVGGSVFDLAIRPDGKIIIGGTFSSYNTTPIQRMARLNTDGTLDNTFTNSGILTSTVVNDVELLADNRILVGLNSSTLVFSLLRFSADGAIDADFVVLLNRFGVVNKVLQLPDGKVLAAGVFRYAGAAERRSLARFNPDGTLDVSLTPYFNNHFPLPILNALAVQADGKILVGASNGVVLTRLNTDGSQDMTFSTPFQSSSNVNDVHVMADGKILVVGDMRINNLPYRFVKLNPNGSLDNTFNPPQPNHYVQKVLVQPDGKILIGGVFAMISDIANRNGVARYGPDGSLDTFNPPGGTTFGVLDMDLQADGKVLVGGTGIRRLNTNGSLDNTFTATPNAQVSAIAVQPDGKIVIGGGFSLFNGVAKNGIVRTHTNGSIDASFTTFANRSVLDIQLLAGEKILVGGLFSRINGVSSVRVARLLNASVPQATLFDYDGDAKADISVFRASENRWYVFKSSDSTVTQTVFAIAGDIPVPADYDGDLKTDVAIYRPSNGAWWYLASSTGAQINVNWGGEAGDIPRPSDFDGDGKTDFIIFRPSNNFWYRINSTGTVSNIQFGLAGDKPVRGDFDGDGKSDVAIFRPSTGDWWYQSSINNAQLAVRWGISTDIPAPADFDGDGRTDFAVFRPSTGVWYVINSSNGSFLIGPFGTPEDKPVPADYDGDEKAELAVFRPSTGIWYQLRTNGGFFAMQFGVGTDTPTPNAFVP